jgi:hypothetical protein
MKSKLELNMKDGCERERTKECNSLENGNLCDEERYDYCYDC